jgi:hypothetical protein
MWYAACVVHEQENDQNMKTYKIYMHPTKGLKAIKSGVSWPALFFGFVWMGLHRFWGYAGFWFVASVWILQAYNRGDLIPIAANATVGHMILAACWLGLNFVCFFRANFWREEQLKAYGYEFLEPASGDSAQEALSRMRAKTALLAERALLSSHSSGHAPLNLDTSGGVNPPKPQTPYRDTRHGKENELRWHYSGW